METATKTTLAGTTKTDPHAAIADRSLFFRNRVNHYARTQGLCSRGVVNHFQALAALHGEGYITKVVDRVVPPELHSSNMPPILKEHYGEEVKS